MNKVAQRCQKDESAKFYYASKRLFFESKLIKVLLYMLAVVPVVLTFIPQVDHSYAFAFSIISFSLSLINELSTTALSSHKEKAILEHQLYESDITGSTFSKIEYDREATNELNELAIRKGLPKMHKLNEYHSVSVPQDITDDYSYIYLCRTGAASDRYLLSRIFYIYFAILMGVIAIFIGAIFVEKSTEEYLSLLIVFYPLVSPLIKDCTSCKKCMKQCAKICADIDNYFADGDVSIERLARLYYYVQNIEFEMLLVRPAIFSVFPKIFAKGINTLKEGVTARFISAIQELRGKNLILKGALHQPTGKKLITKEDFDEEYLQKLEKSKVKKIVKKPTPKVVEKKAVVKEEPKEVKPSVQIKVQPKPTKVVKQEPAKPKTASKTSSTKVTTTTSKTKAKK